MSTAAGVRRIATQCTTDAVGNSGRTSDLILCGLREHWQVGQVVLVGRLWRSVKYERVYLKAYDSVSAARADIADYMNWYNAGRAHSSLNEFTPDEHYLTNLPVLAQAA